MPDAYPSREFVLDAEQDGYGIGVMSSCGDIVARPVSGRRSAIGDRRSSVASQPDTHTRGIDLKLLHLHAGVLHGGVETFLVTLARRAELHPELEHVWAFSFEGRVTEELRETGARVHALSEARFRDPVSIARARRTVKALVRGERPDAVLCHMPKPYGLFATAARRAGAPVILYMHGPIIGYGIPERLSRLAGPPNLLIGVSRHTAETSRDALFPGCATAVVNYPMPWEPGRFDALRAEREATRAEFRTATADVVLVQAARMNAWKGHGELLEALATIKGVPGWTHWLVGGAQNPSEGKYLAELKRRALRLGIADRVRFLGQRTDVPRLLAACDVYCQANIESEGFSLSFTEAFAAGLPVVTTDIGSAAEIVTDEVGALTPLRDAAALGEALATLTRDEPLRHAKGVAARKRALELSDPSRQIGRLREAVASTMRDD